MKWSKERCCCIDEAAEQSFGAGVTEAHVHSVGAESSPAADYTAEGIGKATGQGSAAYI